jgi:transcriptional regulator with XRE-family HTH domain
MGLVRLYFRLPKPDRPVPITIGDHVRLRRLDLGLTLAEAGAMIGVCWNAIMRWEGGTRVPGVTAIPAIVCFLGYDPRPEPEAFAKWLKWMRAALGLNQSAAASALGVPAGTLRAWERGLYLPNAKRMRSIKERASSLLSSGTPV